MKNSPGPVELFLFTAGPQGTFYMLSRDAHGLPSTFGTDSYVLFTMLVKDNTW